METGDLFKRLCPGGSYTPEEQKVRDWVWQHREMLSRDGWTAIEANWLCRFTRPDLDVIAIYSVLSHFEMALKGQHIENKMALQDFRFDEHLKQFAEMKDKLDQEARVKFLADNCLDTRPQWDAVNAYLFEGKDFEDMKAA